MELYSIVYQAFNQYSTDILIAITLVLAVAFLLILVNFLKIKKLTKKYKSMTVSFDNEKHEVKMKSYFDCVDGLQSDVESLTKCYNKISSQINLCFQNVGIVRYNPFDQMGGDQSFSVALLDFNGNGFVITGLLSRNSSATYAKPIENCQSKYPLSDEEKQAIQVALTKKKS